MKHEVPVRKPSHKEKLKSCPSTYEDYPVFMITNDHLYLRNQILLISNKTQTSAFVSSNKLIYNIYGSFFIINLKNVTMELQ